MLSPVDYQEFSWKYINQIIEALADVTPVIVLEKDVGLLNEMGKSKASALEDWTCSQEMPDTCLVEISLYKGILIHQDYYLNSCDQENGTRND
jgi:uroporphyrinogen-III decarboxylase